MNITGAISVTNHTHLEVTKNNHSMLKLTYLKLFYGSVQEERGLKHLDGY